MWGVRDYEHRRAINALEARTYNEVDPIRVSAYPRPIDPFHWSGVVETPAFFALASVNSLDPEVDPDGRMEFRYKPYETPVTLAAKKSYVGRMYLLANAVTGERPHRPLSFAVKLDQDLHVVGDVYDTQDDAGFIKKRTVVPEPGQE